MARLSARDASRWHAVAGRMVALVERAVGPEAMANRARGGGPGWSLEPVGSALRRARRAARSLGGNPLLVRTDVASFYPSVTSSVVATALLAVGAESADARLTGGMLEGWGSEGYPGLPIGPPGSAVVANAVLGPVDEALRGRPFVRWVDDYLVAVPSERAAAEVLEQLDGALATPGLVRSVAKTRLVEGGAAVGWLGLSGEV